MKHIFFMLLLALLIAPVLGATFSNGGFETGTFSPWTVAAGTANVNSYGFSTHSGTYGAFIEASGKIRQDITGAGTNVSLYCKNQGATGYDLKGYWNTNYTNINCVQNTWTFNTFTITGGTGSLYFENTGVGYGIAIDDITVSSSVTTPVAQFSGSPTTGVSPLEVQFTDSSSNTPTSWLWDFGDGNFTSNTSQNPKHLYTGTDLYDVSLKATNSAGSDWENKTDYIHPYAYSDETRIFIGDYLTSNLISGATIEVKNSGVWIDGGITDLGGNITLYNVTDSLSYNITISKLGYITKEEILTNPSSYVDYFYTISTTPDIENPCEWVYANPSKGTVPLYVQFTDTSGIPELCNPLDPTAACAHLWTYGEGYEDGSASDDHTYYIGDRSFDVHLKKLNTFGTVIYDLSCPSLVRTFYANSSNVTPITTDPWGEPTIAPIVYPTSIPVTTPIAGKYTVFYRVKNSSNTPQPEVGIQQWQYKCGALDIFCLFGKHPEQINGGFSDINGNFMMLLDIADYDFKAGGNVNSSNLKTYTSTEGSFNLTSDKYINITSNLIGINTTLYTGEFIISDIQTHSPLENVNVVLYYNDSNNYLKLGEHFTNVNGNTIFTFENFGWYLVEVTKSGYIGAFYEYNTTGALRKEIYMQKMDTPITTNTYTTITPIPTITPPIPNYNRSECRNDLDWENETLWSPILNIESCIGIYNTTYQDYILTVMVMVILGIIIGKWRKSIISFVIGALAGSLLCLFTGLIPLSIWILLVLPLVLTFLMKKEGGK